VGEETALLVVGVSVGALQELAVAPADALDGAAGSLDVEAARRSDCHATDVGAGFLAAWDDGADQIAGGEAADALVAHEVASREPVARQPCALVATAAAGFDGEDGLPPAAHGADVADAGGVESVCFRYAMA